MKEKLRKEYRYIRKNVEDRELKDEVIFQKVINNERLNQAKTLLIYVSTPEEVDTIKIIKYYLNNKLVAVPKIENNSMNFYYINSLNDLTVGYYNILEPTTEKMVTNFDNAVSITPGICFSKDLYRVGYGKGFYDKFYTNHDIYSIGLCYKVCIVEKINHDIFDKKVNIIITD